MNKVSVILNLIHIPSKSFEIYINYKNKTIINKGLI